MKIICSALLFTYLFVGAFTAQAQEGIQFEEGSWNSILEKAKVQNKLVFVDIYTSWCIPCKVMVKDVFPQKEVGDKFNASFINYKLDAEKGDGIEVAKRYKVNGYPTYLFVNGDGLLVYRSTGSMPKDKFLIEASNAILEFTDPKPFAVWEDEYDQKKEDAGYLLGYLQKRKKLKLNSADVLDQFFKVAGKDKVMDSELLSDLALFTNLNVDGPFFGFLLENREAVRLEILEKFKRQVRMNEYLVFVAKNDVERAIENKDENLLLKIVEVLKTLPPDEWPVEWRTYEVQMKYYTKTEKNRELQKVLKSYSPLLLKYDRSIIRIRDSAALAQYDQDVANGKIKVKPEQIGINRKLRGSGAASSLAYRIRDMAKSVLSASNSKSEMKNALKWIVSAEKLSDNFSIAEVKAALLYKMGKKENAVMVQQGAIDSFNSMMSQMSLVNDKILGRLQEQLQKMKQGEPLLEL